MSQTVKNQPDILCICCKRVACLITVGRPVANGFFFAHPV